MAIITIIVHAQLRSLLIDITEFIMICGLAEVCRELVVYVYEQQGKPHLSVFKVTQCTNVTKLMVTLSRAHKNGRLEKERLT